MEEEKWIERYYDIQRRREQFWKRYKKSHPIGANQELLAEIIREKDFINELNKE